MSEIRQLLAAGQRFRAHAFDFACAQLGIDLRLTKFNHPWTNGQAERMVRTVKEATIRRFYSVTHESLRGHLMAGLNISSSLGEPSVKMPKKNKGPEPLRDSGP